MFSNSQSPEQLRNAVRKAEEKTTGAAFDAEVDEIACRRVFSRYDMASAVGVEIPEADFLPLKKRHRLKVEISKYLDTHPGASLCLTRARIPSHV